MTSNILTNIVEELDSKFKAIGNKVLIFVDNAACHKLSDGINLNNIKIVSLPANTTSLIQPLDQGIIRSLKCQYRKSIVAKQHLHLECGFSLEELAKTIDILEALKLVELAWEKVTAETISNCFKKAGSIPGIEINTTDVSDTLYEALGEEIDQHIDIDENVECFGEFTVEDIIEQVSCFQNVDEGLEENSDEDIIKPTKPLLKKLYYPSII
ncbi:tigger transposable element-derived protein 6-like [Musca vetustissima]|uniref:tigger transposable element-derived protein 6-like n=1 Tax=Musca vetustissima TaxID=27455 RepID=UPI002AB6627D|nr:tigger transposable element-derived protein 6-like [Musca vetustissima]